MTRQNLLGLALLIGMIGSPLAPCTAQEPAERLALRGLRDSLALTLSGDRLKALEVAAVNAAREHRDDPYPKMRLGFIELRLAAVTADASHYGDAASEFEWVTELQPDWPMAWLGRGFAELGSVELGPAFARIGQSILGIDPAAKPARYLSRSAAVDSTYLDGILELAALALRQRSDVQLNAALLAFRALGGQPVANNPGYLTIRGRLEREVGDLDSATVALRAALRRNPDDPATLLEFARARFAAGSLEGEGAWYRGLELADSATLAEYRADLDVLMPDSVLHAFDTASGRERAAVARRFWDSRTGAELDAGPERLREHYLRLDQVWRNYLVRPQATWDATPRAAIQPAWMDDRGRIYVRHGKPDGTTFIKFTGAYDNESWSYHRDDGPDLLFHFLKPPGAPGYRSVESLFDIIATTTAARMKGVVNAAQELAAGNSIETYGAGWLASTAQEVLVSREYLSPIYARILKEGKRGAATLQAEERAEGKAALEAPDSWRFGYEAGLDARVDAIAIGTDAAGPQVQVAFAIPGATLFPRRTPLGYLYQVRVRAALFGLDGSRVASLDNTRGYVSREFIDDGRFLLGRMPMTAPPGTYRVRVAIESEGRGTITAWDTVRVPALAGNTLAVSDLALGARSVHLSLTPVPGDTAWVNPVHVFHRDEPMELHFTVGGMSPRMPYTVEIGVAAMHGGGESLRIAFDMKHSGGLDQLHRVLDLRRLGPGDYLMRLVLTTSSGERVTRQRIFTVVK